MHNIYNNAIITEFKLIYKYYISSVRLLINQGNNNIVQKNNRIELADLNRVAEQETERTKKQKTEEFFLSM